MGLDRTVWITFIRNLNPHAVAIEKSKAAVQSVLRRLAVGEE
jgi:hypothetical protein